uniref:Uncharacterized protein n=1 Tax=Parascaris equorum TaxID=6256 RepID=A0A914RRP4_PAREQ
MLWLQAFGVFGLCQLVAFATWLRSKMSEENFQLLFRSILLAVAALIAMAVAAAAFLGS